MAFRSRFFLFCSWLVILSLVWGPLAGAVQPAGAAHQALSAAQGSQNLPDDPAQAVKLLVEQLYGPDEAQAQAAVSELLRRAGLPLVSIDGPLTALPDALVLADAAIYAELLPDLTRAVRRGDFYTPAQLAELLHEIGFPADALTPEVMVAGFGQWGKAPDAPLESQYAAMAVRALAGRRLQVLYRGADLARLEFDPLQVTLILAHATSDARTRKPKAARSPLDRLMALVVPVVYAQNKGPCDDLEAALNPTGQVEETISKVVKDEITDSWKEFALNESAREALGKGSAVYDKGSAVLNMLLLFLGAQIDLSDSLGGVTHFKHAEGDRSKHVNVRARATFDSNIAKKKVACYKLAGVSVPPPGPLKGFKVRWSMEQAQGTGYQGKYLAVVSADRKKLDSCGTCGETTGDDGRSSLELYPPVEKHPEQGKELFGNVRVTASLDKEDFPFKLSDLLALKNPGEFAIGKTWDLAVSAISRAGLPSSTRNIRVNYHGSEIYIARGNSTLFLFLITAPAELDVYTCEGLEGPWQGIGGLGGNSKTIFGGMAEAVTGVEIPENVELLRELRFSINPEASENVFDIFPEIKLTGEMHINSALMAANKAVVVGDRAGQPVGEVDLKIDNNSLAPIAFFSSTTYPVYRMPADPRCPPGEYYFENYP